MGGGGDGGGAARAGCYFANDPNISRETKLTVGFGGLTLATGGALAGLLTPTELILLGVASAPSNLADGLPPFLPRFLAGGKTLGVLRTKAGDIPLQSGWTGPAASVPRGTAGFDIVTRTHVEGHAVALMRQTSVGEATLYINNPAICPSCSILLPRMLPPGSRLTVVTPSGSTTFVGIRQ
jgi:hypothetical protein